MADTFTIGPGLTKPEVGGSENDWGDKLNANFDDVAQEFSNATAGDPNGVVQGDYVGQTYYDSVNRITWTCRVAGSSGTAVWTPNGQMPMGTKQPFHAATAPLGWTVLSTAGFDNAALRLRGSGSIATGGSLDFTTAFAAGRSSDSFTLTAAEVPPHDHTMPHTHEHPHTHPFNESGNTGTLGSGGGGDPNNQLTQNGAATPRTTGAASTSTTGGASVSTTSSHGGGGGHAHGLPGFDVKYVDIVMCERTA